MVKTKKLLALLVVLVLTISFVMSMVVFAEEIVSSVLNFNQIFNVSDVHSSYYGINFVQSNLSINVSGSYSADWLLWLTLTNNSISFISGHKYYINANYQYISGTDVNFAVRYSNDNIAYESNGTFKEGCIFDCTYNNGFLAFYVYPNYTFNFIVTPQIIDLTLMYGAGNEPSLDVCKNTFVSIYSYNTGTPTIDNTINSFGDGYSQGVYDSLKGSEIYYSPFSSYNSLTYINYGNFTGNNISRDIINGVYGVIYSSDTMAFLPFNIKANTILKFVDGIIWCPAVLGTDTVDYPVTVSIGYLYNNNLYNLISHTVNSSSDSSDFNLNNLSFNIPYDIDGIVFYCTDKFMLMNVSATYTVTNISSVVDEAYYKGVEQGKQITAKSSYNKGYNDGVDFASNNNFVTLFSSVIEAPVNAVLSIFDFEVLGYNLKGFFVGLFSMALLLAIIRLFI